MLHKLKKKIIFNKSHFLFYLIKKKKIFIQLNLQISTTNRTK